MCTRRMGRGTEEGHTWGGLTESRRPPMKDGICAPGEWEEEQRKAPYEGWHMCTRRMGGGTEEDHLRRMAYVHQENGKRNRGRPPTKDGICAPGEWEEEQRKATYEGWHMCTRRMGRGTEEDHLRRMAYVHQENGKRGTEEDHLRRMAYVHQENGKRNRGRPPTKDGICAPGEWEEEQRKATYGGWHMCTRRMGRGTEEGRIWGGLTESRGSPRRHLRVE